MPSPGEIRSAMERARPWFLDEPRAFGSPVAPLGTLLLGPVAVAETEGMALAKILGSPSLRPALVGRCFMEHPHSRLEGLILASPRLPSQRFYELNSDQPGNTFWGCLALTPQAFARERLLNFATAVADQQLPPDSLARSLSRVITDLDAPDSPLPPLPRLLALTTWSEQAPNPESRVTLAPDRDALGTPRMHPDPERGVVDANGAVHGVPNLLIAGSSVFPTSGSANPTLTIVALALRMADHLNKELA